METCNICLEFIYPGERIITLKSGIAHSSCACEVKDHLVDELLDDLGNDWNINT